MSPDTPLPGMEAIAKAEAQEKPKRLARGQRMRNAEAKGYAAAQRACGLELHAALEAEASFGELRALCQQWLVAGVKGGD